MRSSAFGFRLFRPARPPYCNDDAAVADGPTRKRAAGKAATSATQRQRERAAQAGTVRVGARSAFCGASGPLFGPEAQVDLSAKRRELQPRSACTRRPFCATRSATPAPLAAGRVCGLRGVMLVCASSEVGAGCVRLPALPPPAPPLTPPPPAPPTTPAKAHTPTHSLGQTGELTHAQTDGLRRTHTLELTRTHTQTLAHSVNLWHKQSIT